VNIATVRILRLALGTAASLATSQAVGWDLSFIAPVFTLLVLAQPLPAPALKSGVGIVLALTLAMYAGSLLLPPLLDFPAAGLLLLVLALFRNFYFTARGGSGLIGTMITAGIGLSAAVGSVSVDLALALIDSLTMNAAIGIAFVWVAHALLPDSMAVPPLPRPAAKAAKPPGPDAATARWRALRATLIVFPVAVWLMLSPASTSYFAVMLKVAAMGQQASTEDARTAARSFIVSTIIGGVAAIIAWQVLSIVPSLSLYVLLVGLAGLIMGPRIFAGNAMAADAATWSSGYLTMIVILAPSVMDTASGNAADAQFWQRLMMFVFATLYAGLAIRLVDVLWPRRVGTNPA